MHFLLNKKEIFNLSNKLLALYAPTQHWGSYEKVIIAAPKSRSNENQQKCLSKSNIGNILSSKSNNIKFAMFTHIAYEQIWKIQTPMKKSDLKRNVKAADAKKICQTKTQKTLQNLNKGPLWKKITSHAWEADCFISDIV